MWLVKYYMIVSGPEVLDQCGSLDEIKITGLGLWLTKLVLLFFAFSFCKAFAYAFLIKDYYK